MPRELLAHTKFCSFPVTKQHSRFTLITCAAFSRSSPLKRASKLTSKLIQITLRFASLREKNNKSQTGKQRHSEHVYEGKVAVEAVMPTSFYCRRKFNFSAVTKNGSMFISLVATNQMNAIGPQEPEGTL